MVERLIKYQQEYGALSKEAQALHIKALDSDRTLRKEVAELSRYFLNREVSNCGWCYIELSLLLLKITKEQMEKKTLEFALLPGVVLHDPINRDFSKLLTPGTITEDLALYHIAFNKNAIKYFARVPRDLDDRLKAFLAAQGVDTLEAARGVQAMQVVALTDQVALAVNAKQKAHAELAKATVALEELEAKLGAAKALDVAPAKVSPVADHTEDSTEDSIEDFTEDSIEDSTEATTETTDFLAAVKDDVVTYIAAGMTNKEIEEAFAEAIADKKVTKSQLTKFAADARKVQADSQAVL